MRKIRIVLNRSACLRAVWCRMHDVCRPAAPVEVPEEERHGYDEAAALRGCRPQVSTVLTVFYALDAAVHAHAQSNMNSKRALPQARRACTMPVPASPCARRQTPQAILWSGAHLVVRPVGNEYTACGAKLREDELPHVAIHLCGLASHLLRVTTVALQYAIEHSSILAAQCQQARAPVNTPKMKKHQMSAWQVCLQICALAKCQLGRRKQAFSLSLRSI